MKVAIAVLSLFFLVAVNAQENRCDTPPKWKGSFREVDFDSQTGRFANVSYDAELEAFEIVEVEREAGDQNRFEKRREVFLFREKKSYYVDLETGRCEERDLTDEFRPFGASGDDEFNGVNYIGAEIPNLGVKVDEYYHADRTRGDFSGSYAPVAEKVCVPVLESYIHSAHGPTPSRSTNTHIQFFNIETVSVWNPIPFVKPPQCS